MSKERYPHMDPKYASKARLGFKSPSESPLTSDLAPTVSGTIEPRPTQANTTRMDKNQVVEIKLSEMALEYIKSTKDAINKIDSSNKKLLRDILSVLESIINGKKTDTTVELNIYNNDKKENLYTLLNFAKEMSGNDTTFDQEIGDLIKIVNTKLS